MYYIATEYTRMYSRTRQIGKRMTWLYVIGAFLVGIGIVWSAMARLRRYLTTSVPVQETKPPVKRTVTLASDYEVPGLTTEMADEWIRECKKKYL